MARRKKEKYIHRWLREHPQIRLYLTREEYEWLKELADERKESMKNILLEALRNARKLADREYWRAYWKAYRRGENKILDLFIDNPYAFYSAVMDRAGERGLAGFDPALFTVPCSKCGKPILFTHRDDTWASLEKPRLLEAFKDYYHISCEK